MTGWQTFLAVVGAFAVSFTLWGAAIHLAWKDGEQ